MVDVDEELGAGSGACVRELAEPRHDAGGLEEDRGDEDGARSLVDLGRHPLGQGLGRRGGQANDLEPRLAQSRELPAERVELAVGGDESRPPAQVERREEADDELVRVLREGDLCVVLAEEQPEAVPDRVGLREGAVPLLVDAERRVLERLQLALARHVGPGLVRVAGEEQPVGDAEGGVVGRQRVRRPPQVVELDHSSLRTDQRSGKAGLFRVVCR